jgi:WD40 repeat protein
MIADALNTGLLIVAAHGSFAPHDGAALIAQTRLSQASTEQQQQVTSQKMALGVRLRATLAGHKGAVDRIVFSPDGRLIATGSTLGTVKLWDAATGELRLTLKDSVSLQSFSPDGRWLATVGDQTAQVWDTVTGALKARLVGHRGSIRSLDWSPDSRMVATGSGDWTVKLWNAETGDLKATLVAHTKTTGKFKKWLLNEPTENEHLLRAAVSFSPDGRSVVTTCNDWTAELWDAASGQLKATLGGHLESYGRPGLDVVIGQPRQEMILRAAFSPDGRLVATEGYLETKLWDASTGELKLTLKHVGWSDMTFSPDGRLFGLIRVEDKEGRPGPAGLWDVKAADLAATLNGFSDVVKDIQWAPDSRALLTISPDERKARLWDASNGALKLTLPMYAKRGFDIISEYYKDYDEFAFRPDSRILLAANQKEIKFWDAASGELSLAMEEARIPAVWSPDGRLLVTRAQDRNRALLWEVASGAGFN